MLRFLKFLIFVFMLIGSFYLGTRYVYFFKGFQVDFLLSMGYLRGCTEALVDVYGKLEGENYLYCVEKTVNLHIKENL